MKRQFRYLAAAVVSAVFAMLLQAAPARAAGALDKADGIYVLTLEGSHYDMGFQQGSLLKDEITLVYKEYLYKKVFEEWTKQFAILGKGGPKAYSNPRGALLDHAKAMEPFIPEEFKEEMHGLADGAGLKYEDVLILSSHVDYFAILCSTFVARGTRTADGSLIEGRNLDWAKGGLKELDAYTTVVVRKPDKGRAFASVIYPGIVGDLTTINDAGVTVELNFSMAVEEENGDIGVPALILVRMLAQYAENVDQAEKIIRDSKRIAGYNVVVTDGKTNQARLIELTAKTVDTLDFNEDALYTTNHFITPALAGKNIEAGNFSSSSPSPERYARLGELLAEHNGAITPEIAQAMMHDNGVMVSGTVQTVVLRPATFDFWVWARNRDLGDFVHFNLKDFLAPAPGTD
jgi:predicted choloylglycine hydrolase